MAGSILVEICWHYIIPVHAPTFLELVRTTSIQQYTSASLTQFVHMSYDSNQLKTLRTSTIKCLGTFRAKLIDKCRKMKRCEKSFPSHLFTGKCLLDPTGTSSCSSVATKPWHHRHGCYLRCLVWSPWKRAPKNGFEIHSPQKGCLANLRSLCFKQASPGNTQTSRILNHNEFQSWELCILLPHMLSTNLW